MCYVPQKGVLFSGTIDSNLKFGGEHITDADVKKAAAIAQATEFIDAKPEGYQSTIAQGGSNLSGGQMLRLPIARAIAKDTKIYLFHDSFSALDFKTDVCLLYTSGNAQRRGRKQIGQHQRQSKQQNAAGDGAFGQTTLHCFRFSFL